MTGIIDDTSRSAMKRFGLVSNRPDPGRLEPHFPLVMGEYNIFSATFATLETECWNGNGRIRNERNWSERNKNRRNWRESDGNERYWSERNRNERNRNERNWSDRIRND